MKEQNNITPPSKKAMLPVTKDERLKELYERRAALDAQSTELAHNIRGEEKFDKVLPVAALAFGVKKSTLRDAYQNDKGALVQKFNTRKSDVTLGAYFGSVLAFFGGCTSAAVGWMLSSPSGTTGDWVFAGVGTSILGTLAGIGAYGTYITGKQAVSEQKAVNAKVREYKQLSYQPQTKKP